MDRNKALDEMLRALGEASAAAVFADADDLLPQIMDISAEVVRRKSGGG